MTTLLEQHQPPHPRFHVVDGRHRLAGAIGAGQADMRCDVVSNGSRGIRVIPIDQLAVDPDVQFEGDYNDRHARALAATWNKRKADPLVVVPIGELSVAERAELKEGADTHRAVRPREKFMRSVAAGEPRHVALNEIVTETGWNVGPSNLDGNIEAVNAIYLLEAQVGLDGLRRTLGIAVKWRNDRSGNSATWLGALGLLVRDDYDQHFRPDTHERLQELAPVSVLRRAQGMVRSMGGGSSISFMEIHYHAASIIRKHARLKRLPARRTTGRGMDPKPVA